ncbi:CD209 antigen-like [Acanthaster planci]|uniref:CD209 antigen-like n=1 Tax=Acanthaster planci TaxID=133434 RepID=A0A8B7ZAC9_ACAPL|nr:CD209 antigen-like [Acanthaster planci]
MVLPKRFIFGLISLHLTMRGTAQNEGCVTAIGHACPFGWTQWTGKCYKALNHQMTWFDAKVECDKMDSDLVVPQSKEETDFLLSMKYYFWINCNDLHTDGVWTCQEGSIEVEYRDWNQGEPNNLGQEEDCGSVWGNTKKWNDTPCSLDYSVICTRPAAPVLHF